MNTSINTKKTYDHYFRLGFLITACISYVAVLGAGLIG